MVYLLQGDFPAAGRAKKACGTDSTRVVGALKVYKGGGHRGMIVRYTDRGHEVCSNRNTAIMFYHETMDLPSKLQDQGEIVVDMAAKEVFMKRLLTGIGLTILLFVPAVAVGQILVAGEGPVVYGHHHLNTTNMDAQKKFFTDTLGGVVAKIGSGDRQQEIIKFPNVLIFFRPMQAPTGGSIGTTVNHIGFSVPDLRPLVAKIKANGFQMITADSVAPNVKVTDDIAAASPTTNLAFALGPEDVKVEFVEVKSQKAPIQLHHIHFFGQMNTEMQAWYAKTFGATRLPPNPGSAFVQDQLPGVFLNFTPSPTPTVGTTGRSIDHIGFEINNLEAFTKKLEAQGIKLDRPYTKVPQLGIAIAFIKDPWGTNIEMTEGLAGVK